MRLKDLGYLYSGLTGKAGEDFAIEDPAQGKPFVPFTNIFNNFRVDVDNVRLVAMTKGEVQNRVETGDILFLMSSEDYESIGKPSVVSDKVGELYLNSFCRGLRITRSEVCPDYVAYYLSAESVRQFLRLEARGFTRINLKIDRLASQEVLLPKLSVQRQIVAYLDEKAAAIDARVAVLEKKFAAYKRLKASVINRAVTRGLDPKAKLKDSGVDWIGKVPVGWEAVRVESHFDVQLGKMLSAKQSDASQVILEYVCAANVHYDGVTLNGLKQMWYLPKEIETFRVKTGDLLVVEGGAGAGGCSVAENVDGIVCMQNSILRIRPTSTGSNRFLNYWFNDLGRRGYISCACNVATIPHFTKEKMRQTPMPYPSPAEQRAIADYLDAECAKINKMAELVTREIELYRKLKRSLINEVVTGKRAVA